MNLKDKLFNRNKSTETVGEWKDPLITHHPTNNEDISVANDFVCMYCVNLDDYIHFLNTSIDAEAITPHNIDVTPYSPDWLSFKHHMYTAHPEQWGYDEVPDTYFKITTSKTSWHKDDKINVAHAYLQIRARLEYGWNFFVVVDGKIHRTLHALPKDETTITNIEWHPRINPLTDKPWTDWRFEKEGETHKRAQNVLPRIVGRTHASIIPVLRGVRAYKVRSHGNEGHILEVNPKRLPKYAHLPSYVNASCIFTNKALKQVQNLRDIYNLVGPGNIGILRLQAGNQVHTESNVQNENLKETKKEEKVVEKQVLETQLNIDSPSINAQDVATKLEQLLPKNDFTDQLMKQINIIFNYARKQSQHEEDFYRIQTELDTTNELLKGVYADIAEAVAETKKVEAERDDFQAGYIHMSTRNQELQTKLDKRGRDKTAKEIKSEMDEATKKTLDKIRNEPHNPRIY
jgi:hypothetical protein